MPSEQQLSNVLSEFAHTLVTDFPIQTILDHLVGRIVDVLPITAAGVTLISSDLDPRYVAASNGAAMGFEELQTELGEGPCLVAYRTGEFVAVPDLREDDRFPRFTSRAVAAGLSAVFTFPLRDGAARLGALDLYRDTPGMLNANAMDAAETLADVASAYLLNAQARADLRDSLDRSRENALHDALTGLPNRVLLMERLDHAIRRAWRSGKRAAVLFADLDRFKLVNDLYGHSAGDELLVAVADRLALALRPGDTLARLSGDEFVILCEDLDEPAEVGAIASRIVAAIAAPFDLSGNHVEVTASVGIAFSGPADQLSEEVLHDADTAMYQAKHRGGGQHQIVDLREQGRAATRTGLEHDLHGALGRGELHVEYQPFVTTADGRISGAEALLRWDHPFSGSVDPKSFIPLAEQAGLITDIGGWILDRACRDRLGWQEDLRGEDFMMSVNVSTHQLMAPDFTASVTTVLDRAETDPGLVTLEVTESVFVQDTERALVVLNELKDLGVTLALDDFGTGYSSLTYLKRFPVDVVKIDQGFVADLEQDRASHSIIFAIVELAHLLGMTVVAEGVETSGQYERLAELGCDFCQGFFFARPMSAGDIHTLVRGPDGDPVVHLPVLGAVTTDS
jgi:diguanylate cyclase (GGDEF)-like protein